MCNNWIKAYRMYSYTVDLSEFKNAVRYPGYFNRTIKPNNLMEFENKFRKTINESGSFEVAGEVCFWKVYRFSENRDNITQRLLDYLSSSTNWNDFIRTIRKIAGNPSYENFIALKNACNQPAGFAVPLTFLAFYKPIEYPMADKHIANWWAKNKIKFGYGPFPAFLQGIYGSILSCKQSWDAYVAWKTFCNDYARRISENCGLSWRARDIEMAVWEAQRNYISLEVLP